MQFFVRTLGDKAVLYRDGASSSDAQSVNSDNPECEVGKGGSCKAVAAEMRIGQHYHSLPCSVD